jgi:hypothetical protein
MCWRWWKPVGDPPEPICRVVPTAEVKGLA